MDAFTGPARPASLVFAAALLGLNLSAGNAGSQTCQTTIPLTSGVSVQANAGPPVVYSVTPGSTRWSAIAVRPNDAEVWVAEARDEPVAYPTCFAPVLAGSVVANLNFLVTDWHHRPAGTDYVAVGTGGGGSPISARVEYEQAPGDGQTNRAFDLISTGPNDFMAVYDYNMFATIPYRIRIVPPAGLTHLRVFVFAPLTSGNGWAARVDRQAELAVVPGTQNVLTFTPTVDGRHAIVILNEDGASGSYYFTVGQCPFSNTQFIDNQPYFIFGLDDWPTALQQTPSWGAIGVRGEFGCHFNLDLATSRNQYGPYPVCANAVLTSQVSGLGTRFVIGDFRSASPGYYPAHVSLEGQPSTISEGWSEWEGGADTIVVNGPPLSVTPPPNNVLDGWSVRLAAGTTYEFQVKPDAGSTANYQLLLFKNPSPGTAYWASRPDAVFQTSTTGAYAPSTSDLYGLVVVNDNGGTGNYTIAVHSGNVDAGAPVIARSSIRRAVPNPLSGSTRIACELARPGRAALELLNAAGRTVTTVDLGMRPAGPVEFLWSRRDDAGRLVRPGIYMAVLRVDGEAVDRRKLTVLTAGAIH